MNNFINHLLSRHIEPSTNIKPRVRSRFEPVTNFQGIYTAAALTGQNMGDENLQDFPLQEQELFKSVSADKPNTSRDQPLPLFPGIFSENNIVNYKPLKSSFPHHPFNKEDNTPLHMKEENTFNPITSSQVVQPAGGLVTPGAATPFHREPKTTTREEDLLNTNNENRTADYFKEHLYTKENPLPINPNSHSGETVKPALKKYGAEGLESQSRMDSFPGLLNQPRRLNDFDRITGLNRNETSRPVIKVTIGRIDVRAVVQTTPSSVRSTTTVKPQLSLENYLKQRNNTRS